MTTRADPSIAAALRRLDWFRRSPARFGGPGEHKEWQHFLVHAPDFHLLVNFDLIDEGPHEVARVIVLVRAGECSRGEVVRFAPDAVEVPVGGLQARFGRNVMRFVDDAYELELELPSLALRARLRLASTTMPAIANNQPLAPNRTLSWLFVPRLRASGFVELDGRRIALDDALAYHDHNWGHFAWGDDFAWEWGSLLPWSRDNPWSAVYMRMADRGRARASCQGLYLWRGATPGRIFRDHELEVSLHGRFVAPGFLQVPPVMGLLCPRASADLPARIEVRAQAGDDVVELAFELEQLAQILMPHEHDVVGVTALNEVAGRTTMQGRIGGERVELVGPGMFEFIREQSAAPLGPLADADAPHLDAVEPGPLARLVGESFELLARERPDAYARMLALLRGHALVLVLDDEALLLRFDAGVMLEAAAADHAELPRVECRVTTILAVVDAKLSLAAALEADLLRARANLDSLATLHEGLLAYVHGAVRCPGFPALLARLRIIARSP